MDHPADEAATGDAPTPPPGSPPPPPAGGASRPVLPPTAAKVPDPIQAAPTTVSPTASNWYRSDRHRQRSVYRRANPWYRRLGRGVVAISIVAVVAAGVYVGARAAGDYLDRDKLPSIGAEPEPFRSTAFLISSSAPAPAIDGTFTIDVDTHAFQFVGGVSGPQRDVEVVSPDGARVYVRNAGGPWREAGADDAIATDLQLVIPHLLFVVDSDDVLAQQLRRGFVDLTDKVEIGSDDLQVDRYELLFDTKAFAANQPLQWDTYRERVVPAMVEAEEVPVTMSVDADDVVIGLDDNMTNWAWQRLNYLDTPFTPLDPAG